eukprot:TRINITY_DN3573_c1_g2_i1.p1 TRINITY_DN3573_c1_g2~~TRINITY_DN3573_c1_g2_i1.p1  ORF type:complete len:505 (+),score=99.68 TRINITY_DN3573_c1_g2_i1:70-1584(+)
MQAVGGAYGGGYAGALGGGTKRKRDTTEPTNGIALFKLPPGTTQEELQTLLWQQDGFDSVRLIVDRNTGESKGMAFAYFHTIPQATACKQAVELGVLSTAMLAGGTNPTHRIDVQYADRSRTPGAGQFGVTQFGAQPPIKRQREDLPMPSALTHHHHHQHQHQHHQHHHHHHYHTQQPALHAGAPPPQISVAPKPTPPTSTEFRTILVTMNDVKGQFPGVDALHDVVSAFGNVQRISHLGATQPQRHQLLVQLADATQAAAAVGALKGRSLGYCTLDAQIAQVPTVEFDLEDDNNKDYTVPDGPYEKRVLLVSLPQYAPFPGIDALQQLFAPYGYVERISHISKPDREQALVQFSDATAAQAVLDTFNGVSLGYCTLELQHARVKRLTFKANDERNRDFTLPTDQTAYAYPAGYPTPQQAVPAASAQHYGGYGYYQPPAAQQPGVHDQYAYAPPQQDYANYPPQQQQQQQQQQQYQSGAEVPPPPAAGGQTYHAYAGVPGAKAW